MPSQVSSSKWTAEIARHDTFGIPVVNKVYRFFALTETPSMLRYSRLFRFPCSGGDLPVRVQSSGPNILKLSASVQLLPLEEPEESRCVGKLWLHRHMKQSAERVPQDDGKHLKYVRGSFGAILILVSNAHGEISLWSACLKVRKVLRV